MSGSKRGILCCMEVRILAFASAAEAMGRTESSLSVAEGTTVAMLRRELEGRHPELGALWERLAVAVNGEIADSNQLLTEGCEVALLPPVSGGSSRASLVDGELDLDSLEREMHDPGAGALLVFVGRPRNRTGDREVLRLVYQAYESMAVAALDKIAGDLESATVGLRVRIVHRLGEVEIGRPSVAIAVSSPHRDASYQASREALERLKREVPIWKQEVYADGEATWREVEPLATPVEFNS